MPNILNSPLTPYPSPLYLPPPPAYPLKLLNTIYSIFNAKLDTFEYHTINWLKVEKLSSYNIQTRVVTEQIPFIEHG